MLLELITNLSVRLVCYHFYLRRVVILIKVEKIAISVSYVRKFIEKEAIERFFRI